MITESDITYDEYDSPGSGDRVLFIVNPFAGKGVTVKKLQLLISELKSSGWRVTLYLTKATHDATFHVAEYGARFDRIICLGGDGTLNEVITGLISVGKNIPVGYIPAGSTNDLGFSIGMPRDNLRAARRIVHGQTHFHDVGLFNGENFVYIASFGAFTEVSWATPQSAKKMFGHSAYVIEGAKALFSIKPYNYRVITDDNVFEGKYIYCGVSNTFSVGGMYRFSKTEADLSDGLLEVMLVEEPSRGDAGVLVNQLLMHDFNSKYIRFIHSREASFESLDGIYPIWTTDGEKKVCNSSAYLSCLHDKICMIY